MSLQARLKSIGSAISFNGRPKREIIPALAACLMWQNVYRKWDDERCGHCGARREAALMHGGPLPGRDCCDDAQFEYACFLECAHLEDQGARHDERIEYQRHLDAGGAPMMKDGHIRQRDGTWALPPDPPQVGEAIRQATVALEKALTTSLPGATIPASRRGKPKRMPMTF